MMQRPKYRPILDSVQSLSETAPRAQIQTGYSVFAGGMGSITTPRFELDGVTNTFQIVAYSQAGLRLGSEKGCLFDTIHTSHWVSNDSNPPMPRTRDGATSFLYTWSDPNLSSTYTVTPADALKTIKVRATFH